MKWFSSLKISSVLLVFVAIPTVAAVLAQSAITSDTEVVITIAGQEHRYQPRPELGYVVKAENNDQVIASVYGDISSFAETQIRPVGGRERQGLWILEKRQSAALNEAVIKALDEHRHVQYVAPLFSCNGETEAIIPEIIVRVTSGTQSEEIRELCRVLNLRIKRKMMFTEQEYLIEVLGKNADVVLAGVIELNQVEFIEWAAPNVVTQRRPRSFEFSDIDYSEGNVYLYNAPRNISSTGFIPDDEYFPMQWHLHNTGQFGGTPNADINAPEAWEITKGDPNIVVALVDSGVDLDHPDLFNNLVPGYDFENNDDSPEPRGSVESAHGTACAGLVAAEGDNGIGVVGVTHNCKVMPIRATVYGAYPDSQLANAIRWAAEHGADIISNSWSSPTNKPIVRSAIMDVTRPGGMGRDGKGCIVVVASDNQGSSLPRYPSVLPEIIAVGATDPNDVRYDYSNFGPHLDIVAPSGNWDNRIVVPQWTTDIAGPAGYSVDNTDPSILDYTDTMGGTSGACPVAAGVAALILSVEPELTCEEVRHFLTRSAKDLGSPGRDDYYGWGRVDARAALDMVLAKRADLNNDWKVDLEDLLVLIEFWGATETSADIAPATRRDGIVDEQDLDLMMRYWQTKIPELGLIAHWRLDETEGNIAYDSVDARDGVVIGEAIWQPDAGKVNGTLQFDGIDDHVITDSVLDPADGPFSVFAWIKGGAPGQVIISQSDGIGSGETCLGTDMSDGKLMTGLVPPPVGRFIPQPLSSQAIITDGQWHHIGFVWDGSHRTLYVDRVAVAEDTQPGLEGSQMGLYIGTGKAMEPGTYFSGLIDDVRIYNRAVSP